MKKAMMKVMEMDQKPHQTLPVYRIIVTVMVAFSPFIVWKLFKGYDRIALYPFSLNNDGLPREVYPVHYVLELGHYLVLVLLLNVMALLCKGNNNLHIFLKVAFWLAIIKMLVYMGWRYDNISNTLSLAVFAEYCIVLLIYTVRRKKWVT